MSGGGENEATPRSGAADGEAGVGVSGGGENEATPRSGAADGEAGGGNPLGAFRSPGVHHVGISVADVDRSVSFWEPLLGTVARDRRVLDGPNLGVMVGYPGVRIDSCWIDLPGGVALEILHYLDRAEEAYDPGTAHPGNVHVCLEVEDMAAAHARAVACGATPVSAQPIEVRAGPQAGSRRAYLRDPDGITLELVQPAPVGT